MALQLKNGIFYHIPRTGGTWLRRVLMSRAETKEVGESVCHIKQHCSPLEYKPDRFSFTFLRSPADWYASYFDFKKGRPDTYFDKLCMDDDFGKFMDNVYKYYPMGYASVRFTPFLKCDYIGRFETIHKDVDHILNKLDLPLLTEEEKNYTHAIYNFNPVIESEINRRESWI